MLSMSSTTETQLHLWKKIKEGPPTPPTTVWKLKIKMQQNQKNLEHARQVDIPNENPWREPKQLQGTLHWEAMQSWSALILQQP